MQTITSAKTSRNQLPAGAKKISWEKGYVNFDFGAGKFNKLTEYLKGKGVYNLRYDPYNLPAEHNDKVLKMARVRHINSLTCFNVLNVVKKKFRTMIIKHCYEILSKGGTAYFQVYQGDKSGIGKRTRDGYQTNMKKSDYIAEIKEIFFDKKFKII